MAVTKVNFVLWDEEEGLAGDFTHGQTYHFVPGITGEEADQLMEDLKGFLKNYACKLPRETRMVDPESPDPVQNNV